MHTRTFVALALSLFPAALRAETAPDWTADAIWYQIFPERFRNGDPTNDPTRTSLDNVKKVPADWAISRWTADWYAKADWEKKNIKDFIPVFSRRYGGDLQGVLDKLPYLRDLGVNALYLNPVFHSPSLHKYDGASFHHIDPFFGPDPQGDLALMATETSDPKTWKWTAADQLFLKLVKEAHALGFRVIIDGVFNHTGRDFFAFQDLIKRQKESPYTDWYIVKSFDDPATPADEFNYAGWWGFNSLPEFANSPDNQNMQSGPKAYISDITRRWMDPNADGNPEDGVDGWRLDVADEVPAGFWKDWNALVQSINPQARTFAEVWDDPSHLITHGGFNGAMNYHGFAIPVKGFLIDETVSPSEFGRLLIERRMKLPEAVGYTMQNLMDSHDTDRVASMIVNRHTEYVRPEWYDYDQSGLVSPRDSADYKLRAPDAQERETQRLVALLQATALGAPMIYYGTEAGMWGADDPDNRQPMWWDGMKFDPQSIDPRGTKRKPDAIGFDQALHDYFKSLFAMRRESAALRRGTFSLVGTNDAAGLFAFARTLPEERVVVILNRSAQEQPMTIPTRVGEKEPKLLLCSSTAPDKVRFNATAASVEVKIPARSGVVIRMR